VTIIVTGAAGFIGANFVLDWVRGRSERVVSVDLLTYAGNLENLEQVRHSPNHVFIRGDICDAGLFSKILNEYEPRAVLNFAAESHVDRSILDPAQFLRTNVGGVCNLLECIRIYCGTLAGRELEQFRFLQVSTDEVFGSLERDEPPFHEARAYQPNSPYSASKAAADHFVRAYFHTYGVPVLTTNCSNNYGPYQFPEKLIPLVIHNALVGKQIPIYGNGRQVRDWLFVGDHCAALRRVLDAGLPGQTYNIGGNCERENLDVVKHICLVLDELRPREGGTSYQELIAFVRDRPGHDRRYAVDTSRIERELNWSPAESFESGIRKTIDWNLANQEWLQRVTSGAYRDWMSQNYSGRS
jgi:dTDP-glucose 4,6-dehydratase